MLRIGLDIGLRKFAVHIAASGDRPASNVTLQRDDLLEYFSSCSPSIIGMETGGGCHHWGRELARLGHNVRLIPAAYVKPFVKRGKTDANDAEAITEAMCRPNMRRTRVKTLDQQSALAVHRVRQLFMKQRTQIINAIRGHLAEFGVEISVGIAHVTKWIEAERVNDKASLPEDVHHLIQRMGSLAARLTEEIAVLDGHLIQALRRDASALRLRTIPGVGILGATALAATFPEPQQFGSARQFSAFLGLTPLPDSSGGIRRRERMSKRGDPYIRHLLLAGARAQMIGVKRWPERADPWTAAIVARKPWRVASVAIANKMARIAWALMAKGGEFSRAPVTQPAPL